jgi:three-Cys-motif partner protein
MKTSHTFGGDWTEQKLERLQKYLKAYTTIFTKNERAQSLIPIYVDAFAGTGYRTSPLQLTKSLKLFEEFTEPEVDNFLKGSARLALEVEPSFQKYIFIEQNTARVEELQKLQTIFPKNKAISKLSRVMQTVGCKVGAVVQTGKDTGQ